MIGQSIRALRLRRGLTQKSLARLAGMSTGGLAYVERNLRPNPRWSTVRNIALALGVSVDEIASGEFRYDRA